MNNLVGSSLFGGLMDYLNQNKAIAAAQNAQMNQALGPQGPALQSMTPQAMADPFAPKPPAGPMNPAMAVTPPERQSLFGMVGQNFKQGLQDRIGNQDELSPGQFGSTPLGQFVLKQMMG